ncbi:hypothetical protein [Stenotrophomonas sp. SY1]|uniref:hypothetical protein n=1 Tax=Stenotrophomonas sp. SY1 TaxID=477235 RepID=UPI001E4D2261|nr:hypothetical protein [Stenotrophomonas sp. SY1]MCD9085448.1 hypothetical protein [Stenotrophomonas sp. SY1]
MDSSTLLQTLLVSVGYRLPILIALGVAWVMLLDTPRGKVRAVALWAVAILLLAGIGAGVLNVLPLLFIAAGKFDALGGLNTLLSVLNFILSLVQATGFVLLAWALVQALRRPLAPANT